VHESSYPHLLGAQAVINGDFINYTGYYTNGMAVGDGVKWRDDNASMGFLAAGNDRIFLSPTEAVVSTLEGWIQNAVGGFPTLVRDGVAQYGATAPSHCPERHPRTAVGLSKDRQHLYLVIVDGRTTASRGMTCNELADLMVDLGAWSALNFDGGGSIPRISRLPARPRVALALLSSQ
jgi:exopolysaccharide biosynthesis protein